jgi:hypothetical protein
MMEVTTTMPRNNESQTRAGAERDPDEASPRGSKPSGSKRKHAVNDPALRLEETRREVSSKVNQVRQRIQHNLAALSAKIESTIETDEEQRDWEHDSLKEGDIEMVEIMTVDQRSKYDVYARSQGPSSTRPVDDRIP